MEEQKTVTPPKSQTKTLTLYEVLSKPIPKEHLFTYTEDKKTFTGYNAQYAINLLNEVIGYGKWWTHDRIQEQFKIDTGFLVSMQTTLFIAMDDKISWNSDMKHEEWGDAIYRCKVANHLHYVQGVGALFAKNPANAYKGAKTSAFKNACRYLGIGKELYTGEFDEDTNIEETTTQSEIIITGEDKTLEQQINDAKTVEQLSAYEQKINNIKDTAVQGVIMKQYNKRKIALIEKL